MPRRPQRSRRPSHDFDCGLVTLLCLGVLVIVATFGAAYRQVRSLALDAFPRRRAPRRGDVALFADSIAGCKKHLGKLALGDAGPVIITGLEDSGTRGAWLAAHALGLHTAHRANGDNMCFRGFRAAGQLMKTTGESDPNVANAFS